MLTCAVVIEVEVEVDAADEANVELATVVVPSHFSCFLQSLTRFIVFISSVLHSLISKSRY